MVNDLPIKKIIHAGQRPKFEARMYRQRNAPLDAKLWEISGAAAHSHLGGETRSLVDPGWRDMVPPAGLWAEPQLDL